ncbi:MAG: metallophosphoesterase [Flavipsychrobacter sp.]
MRTRFLIFLTIVLLAEFYSFILIRSIAKPMANPWKAIIYTSYIAVTLFTWTSFILMRSLNWDAMPPMAKNLIIAFTMGLWVAKILAATVMMLDDVRRICMWVINYIYNPTTPDVTDEIAKSNGISRSTFFKRTALILGGTAVGAFLYGITNRYNYKVHRVKLKFANLPASFKGLKIVQISDIHSGSFDNEHAVSRGVEKVMHEEPDIIFFTGDLVNNKAEEIQPYTHLFSQLTAPLGVYSTLGNHDYGDYVTWPSDDAKRQNLEQLKETHDKMGWRLLMNEHVEIEKGNDKIAVIGIENWGAKAGFPKYGSMSNAYAGLKEKDIPFKVLLSHDPSHWDAEVIKDYQDIDLTLSGHTHGMQFGIEIPGLKWSPVKYIYKNWAGLYQKGAQHLYVNRGFGFLGYPGRLGILPEITVIELA